MAVQKASEKPLIFLAMASLCLLTPAAQAKSPKPQDSDISGVVHQTLNTYKKDGLAGLIVASQDCYKHRKAKFYCIHLDIAASQIDSNFAASIGTNRHPYYMDDQFFRRATPVFVNSGMSMQQSNDYLTSAFNKIKRLLSLKENGSDIDP